METLGALFGVSGLLALVIGLGLFLPVAGLKRHRGTGKWLLIGGGAAFVFGVIISPAPPEKQTAEAVSTTPKAVTTSPTAPVPKVTPTGDGGKAAFIAFYHQLISETKPCDQAVKNMDRISRSGNRFEVYQAAKEGSEACQHTAAAIGEMKAPDDLAPTIQNTVAKAVTICSNAYTYRQSGLEKAMAIADGDDRPSKVSDAVDDLKTGQTGVLLCVAELYGASTALGINPKQL